MALNVNGGKTAPTTFNGRAAGTGRLDTRAISAPMGPNVRGTAPLDPRLLDQALGGPTGVRGTAPLQLGHPLLGRAALPPAAPVAQFPQGTGRPSQAAIAEAVAASQAANLAFWHAHRPEFTLAGQQAAMGLIQGGRLDATDGETNLRDVAERFLRAAGRHAPAAAAQGEHARVTEALFRQIAEPEARISQLAGRDTCVAATMQLALAKDNPAQYFQVGTALLNGGKATLPSGKVLEVSEENRRWIDAQPYSPAAKLNALFQAAFMDHANGEDSYSLEHDVSTAVNGGRGELVGRELYKGLDIKQAKELSAALGESPALEPAEVRRALGIYLDVTPAADGKGPGGPEGEQRDTVLFDLVKRRYDQEGKGLLVTMEMEPGKPHLMKVREMRANGDVVLDDPSAGHGPHHGGHGGHGAHGHHGHGGHGHQKRRVMSRHEFTGHLSMQDQGIGTGTTTAGTTLTGTRR